MSLELKLCNCNKFAKYSQKLDKLLSKGKNILQLTAICSKYETEREKVQPFKSQGLVEGSKRNVVPKEESLNDFKEVSLL